MFRHSLQTLLLFLAAAGIILAQAPEKRSDPRFGSVEVHLESKWFIYPMDWYAVELIAPPGLTPPVRVKQLDKQGSARIGLLSPGRHLLNIKQWNQGQLSQRAELSCQIEIAAGDPMRLQIPFDLKPNLVPCPYDDGHNPPRSFESTEALEIDASGYPPNGYPTTEVMRLWSPSLLLMSPPRKLPFRKGLFSIQVFPDVAYASAEPPASLGLLINDTDSNLEFSHLTIFLEAQDANGQWQPIEGPSRFVSDYRLPPVLLPAHSCRNFLIRHYKGPFKTHLRVVMKEAAIEKTVLISEPFEGSIHLSQIDSAMKLWTVKR